jgi:dihydrofolate reductase
MGNVIAGFTMSLDGFIADPNDDIGQLFKWYFSGDTEFPTADGMVFKVSAASATLLKERFNAIGAVVTGRHDFDVSKAWGGKAIVGDRVFILTHRIPPEWVYAGSPFTFVTDGIESAIAQAQRVAGERNVVVGSSTTVQQCLKAGLLDEIEIDLAPILLGAGIRLFEYLGGTPIDLEQIAIIEGTGVTHLHFRVVK